MLIYMDLCCFNRPFDDQLSKSVYLETEAKLFIQSMIKAKTIGLAWSYIMSYENFANPDRNIRNSIGEWQNLSSIDILETTDIINMAKSIHKKGIGKKDSLHISCAIEAKSDLFITVDKGIIRKSSFINQIKILNPIDFIQQYEGEML